MAQVGIHALVGAAFRRLNPKQEWLTLGIILGSIFPDLDNYTVAVANLAKLDTHGLHRTFTHSLLTILVAVVVFFLVAKARRQPRWNNLGIGIGVGIGLHIVLDLLIWFNGVELLWPFGGWVNLWKSVKLPDWLAKLLDPAEFLFFALFFVWLARSAQVHHKDVDFLGKLRWWTVAMLVFFVVFTPLAYLMTKGFLTIYGAFYLISITAAVVIAIRMRQTIEAV